VLGGNSAGFLSISSVTVDKPKISEKLWIGDIPDTASWIGEGCAAGWTTADSFTIE